MSCHYRCSKCRGRNVLPRLLSEYKRPRKCKHCGHGHFYLDKERTYRSVCRCEGSYHWGAHRPGSRMCEHNSMVDVHRARRAGASDTVLLDLAAEAAWDKPGVVGADCPF